MLVKLQVPVAGSNTCRHVTAGSVYASPVKHQYHLNISISQSTKSVNNQHQPNINISQTADDGNGARQKLYTARQSRLPSLCCLLHRKRISQPQIRMPPLAGWLAPSSPAAAMPALVLMYCWLFSAYAQQQQRHMPAPHPWKILTSIRRPSPPNNPNKTGSEDFNLLGRSPQGLLGHS